MESIKVRMKVNAASPNQVHQEGHEYTMPDAVAKEWIVNRYAVATDAKRQAAIMHEWQESQLTGFSANVIYDDKVEPEVEEIKPTPRRRKAVSN